MVLPSAPQTKPLEAPLEEEDDLLGYETDAGRVKSHKSEGERLSKEQRRRQGCKRITAYCIAEALKTKTLAGFLRREHNVVPRVFDEAIYALYHLPLLPGYGIASNVRSSAPPQTASAATLQSRMSEAEENGYQGTYFTAEGEVSVGSDGFIPSSSPLQSRNKVMAESDAEGDMTPSQPELSPMVGSPERSTVKREFIKPPDMAQADEPVGEVVFFDYGVVVFFGLEEGQERSIIEDITNAEILKRPIPEEDWEVEECHFEHNPSVAHPRIFNDYFTLKSTSHLLKLSIAHAFAQSTTLARYETNAQRVLSAPETVAIPRMLARTGALKLRRRAALRITGKLFTLRRDVNLVSNVLDVPELFWSEASLKDLYDAVRDYMEIDGRVEALNEKLSVVNELLDAIHDDLNHAAMERITWIIIWLIVVACLVEMGEVIARLAVHTTTSKQAQIMETATQIAPLTREEVLRTLERMMQQP